MSGFTASEARAVLFQEWLARGNSGSMSQMLDSMLAGKGAPIFTALGPKIIGGTVTETSCFSSGVGSLALPANFWTAGRSLLIEGDILFSTAAVAPSLTVRVTSNGAVLASSSVANLLSNANNNAGHFKCLLVCRAVGVSGSIAATGVMDYATAANARGFGDLIDVKTVNTTIGQSLDVTAQWGSNSASNTLTVINALIRDQG